LWVRGPEWASDQIVSYSPSRASTQAEEDNSIISVA
jgi:hypothetical protein